MTDRVESAYMSTPVENLFIDECLASAPGDYVKVYLYGLRFALYPLEQDMSLEEVSKALHMTLEQVNKAIAYWQDRHIIKVLEPDSFKLKYLSVQQGLVFSHVDDTAYRYADFNLRLQTAVGGSRMIKPEDYQTVYAWMEELDLEQDAVILLVRYYIDARHNMAFSTMDKKVRIMAQDYAYRTLEEVKEFLEKGAPDHPAKIILEQWGILRSTTVNERAIWNRWNNEWGFSHQSLIQIARTLTYLRNPNFKSMDRMVTRLYQDGLVSDQQVTDYLDNREMQTNLAQELGCSVHQVAEAMPHWQSLGFSTACIQMLYLEVAREYTRPTLDAMDHLAQTLADAGMTTVEDIEAYGQQYRRKNRSFVKVLQIWGEAREPRTGELAQWNAWMELGYSPELCLEAAHAAAFAQDRVRYMNGVLAGWKKRGITTAQAAQEENQRRKVNSSDAPNLQYDKPVDFYRDYFSDVEELE